MENVIPKNVFSFDVDYFVTMPRMEKGYKNEVQYSKLTTISTEKKPEAIEKGRGSSSAEDRQGVLVRLPAAVLLGHHEGSSGVRLGGFRTQLFP